MATKNTKQNGKKYEDRTGTKERREGEFVEPKEGLVVEGTLVDAFGFDGNYGRQYVLVVDTGEKLTSLVGIKGFMKKGAATCYMGDDVRITFKEFVEGETKRDPSYWTGTFEVAEGETQGESVREMLSTKKRRTEREAVDEEDVPF